jgi:hypothetical protein
MLLPRLARVFAVVLALAPASSALAGSNFATGSGSLSTSVTVRFSITIPRFVYLRVGSASGVNTLSYAPTVAQMVASTAVLGSGGDTGSGNSDLTVQVVGNAGNVTLTASTGAPTLVSGARTMPWSTLSAISPTGTITAPQFNSGGTVLTASGGVVNQLGSWRYSWTNPAATVYAAGTYTGTVTFTAAAP